MIEVVLFKLAPFQNFTLYFNSIKKSKLTIFCFKTMISFLLKHADFCLIVEWVKMFNFQLFFWTFKFLNEWMYFPRIECLLAIITFRKQKSSKTVHLAECVIVHYPLNKIKRLEFIKSLLQFSNLLTIKKQTCSQIIPYCSNFKH
jgi:hypothetical protein